MTDIPKNSTKKLDSQRSQRAYESRYAPTWCPGCGNFAIWTALKKALARLELAPHRVLLVYGVGCSGNMANTLNVYGWHSLHGRALPTAVGAKLANSALTVLAAAGDGDGYGEGLSHFIHAVRGNVDITYMVHNNSVYGLTTGQAAPTAHRGFKAKTTPAGLLEEPINPIALAISSGATFAARGYSGEPEYLVDTLVEAIRHPGFSLVDIFQPCVTFNRINTYAYYNKMIERLDADKAHDPSNRDVALTKAFRTDRLPIGVIYRSELRPSYEIEYLHGKPLVSRAAAKRDVTKLYKEFI